MAQRTILKAKGLYTDPNQLSGVPEGSQIVADNVIIDRDDTIEPRRGFSQYGNTFGNASDRAKQLLVYKQRVLVHYNNTLLFDDGNENFQAFSGIFEEVSPDLRIRGFESNKNFYFTTADGIKKIAASTADDFTTAADYITDAGAAKALDVTGVLNSTSAGFLVGNSKVAYRIVWGYKDINDNLLLGSPSSRLIITNFNNFSANVDLSFAIPQNVTDNYFYQVYRTAVFTATGNLTIDDIDPGDEMQLVIEDFPTTGQLSAGLVDITDIAPEDFRQGGLLLYTNPNSGEGIDQANEPPPKASDVTMYQSTLFYANTESRARREISLLGVSNLQDGVSTFNIDDGINPPRVYTFVGKPEETNIDFSLYSETIANTDGKYFLLNSASDKRKYYVWYDITKTTQTIDFTTYTGTDPADIDSKYFILYTQDPELIYYVWYDGTGNTTDPGLLPINGLTGFVGIKVDVSPKTGNINTTTTGASITVTSAAHSLSNGDTVNIEDSDTVPSIDGEHVISNVTADTYDITPVVAVTGAGTTGKWVEVITLDKANLANLTQLAIDNIDQNNNDYDINYATGSSTGDTVTLGDPTSINSTTHGLETGDSVTISNSTTTPNIDGDYRITKVDNDNFTIDELTTIGGTADWDAIDTLLHVETESFDDSRALTIETIQKGFSYTVSTPFNSDPGNDVFTYTDVEGRSPFRVNISRGIIDNEDLADATAAAILDQDSALDFTVDYIAGDEYFNLTTNNNGNTTDAQDAASGSAVGEAVTFGNPTSINSPSHGLKDGDYVTISASTTTPNIDDSYNITKVDDDNFTIPIITTVSGTADWDADSGMGNGFVITVTQQGDGEDSEFNHVLLSASPEPGEEDTFNGPSPAQRIDETARSLVNIINKDPLSPVYAFYISGANDLPGQFLLEARDIGTNSFTITANDATTGEQFNPTLPPGTNSNPVLGEAEIKPNRIYFAKLQQPEAVPILNFIDVGPEDKAISRILPLRESLFILKEDGVYRLTGLDGNFSVDLFDESTKIIAPDSAVVLNNQIYCLTNQGIVVISDTGISIISRQIDNIIRVLTSSSYDFNLTSFGVSYETDRTYLLWLPTSVTDTVATQAYRYSTITNSWTRYDLAKTCGIVNSGDDKLYLGPNDENFIEQERKNYNRTDFADRDFQLIIPTDAIEGTTLKLSSSQDVDIGDAIVQTQYLTINEYNQLLAKLDLDPGTGDSETTNFDFSSYTGTIPDDLHSKYFFLYAAGDVVKYVVFYDSQGDLPSLDPTVFTDVSGAEQIRVDISSGVSTKTDLAQKTATAISTATFDFITSHAGVNEYFTTTTSRNGDTTDAFDSPANGISNGFSITITNQGVGNYFDSLEANSGANLAERINALAVELDNDPGITQNDFASSIATYNATGSTIILGDPTTINETSHGLQTGRLVTITNSTSTPSIDGSYTITKVDDDNFTIEIETTAGGTCDWSAGLVTFAEIQSGFNTIINKLNNDSGVFYQNYLLSEDSKDFEVLVIDKANNTTDVEMQFSTKFIEGPITVYEGIQTNVVYTPETFGDTSVSKHVREGTFIFENSNFSRGTVGYKTDLSPGFDTIDFTKAGKGDWSLFAWSEHNWGGGFSGVPLRTYIPRQKQRCRYTQAQFKHDSAREQFILFGISYTFRPISEKAYRD